jgi:hypothetical protein
MQPSETVRVERTVSGNVIPAINEMDRSHWMLQNVEILIQAFFNTPMVPHMYHTTALLPILDKISTALCSYRCIVCPSVSHLSLTLTKSSNSEKNVHVWSWFFPLLCSQLNNLS